MNLEQLINIYTGLVGSAHPVIWLGLFLDCLVGDSTGLTLVPSLSEATWLFSGYLLGGRSMPVLYLLPMIVAAQAGRQTGTWLFFRLAANSTHRLLRRFPALNSRFEASRLAQRLDERRWWAPFLIALGCLFWLKFPIYILIATTKRFRTLAAGVLISGLVYDGTYILIGVVMGKNLTLSPVQVLPYVIVGLALSFGLTLVFRQLWKFVRSKLAPRQAEAGNLSL